MLYNFTRVQNESIRYTLYTISAPLVLWFLLSKTIVFSLAGNFSCSKDEFRCDSMTCISEHLLCDGRADCEDRSDEKWTVCKGKQANTVQLSRLRQPRFCSWIFSGTVTLTANFPMNCALLDNGLIKETTVHDFDSFSFFSFENDLWHNLNSRKQK